MRLSAFYYIPWFKKEIKMKRIKGLTARTLNFSLPDGVESYRRLLGEPTVVSKTACYPIYSSAGLVNLFVA